MQAHFLHCLTVREFESKGCNLDFHTGGGRLAFWSWVNLAPYCGAQDMLIWFCFFLYNHETNWKEGVFSLYDQVNMGKTLLESFWYLGNRMLVPFVTCFPSLHSYKSCGKINAGEFRIWRIPETSPNTVSWCVFFFFPRPLPWKEVFLLFGLLSNFIEFGLGPSVLF